MSLQLIIWYFFTASAVICTILLLLVRNLMHAALSFLIVLLSIAALFVLANAEFLAVSQILLYIGGVLVLLIFGIMLTENKDGQQAKLAANQQYWGILLASGFFFFLIIILNKSLAEATLPSEIVRDLPIKQIGFRLITEHLLVFEVAGILLLVALVGAAVIAAGKTENNKK